MSDDSRGGHGASPIEGGDGRRSWRLPVSPATVIATIALIVALGGVAHSAIPGPDGKIYACYSDNADPDLSYMYLRDHDQSCQDGETAISWDQSGEGADQQKLAEVVATLNSAAQLDAQFAKATEALDEQSGLFSKLIKKTLSVVDLKPFSKKQGQALGEINKAEAALEELQAAQARIGDLLNGIVDKQHNALQGLVDAIQ